MKPFLSVDGVEFQSDTQHMRWRNLFFILAIYFGLVVLQTLAWQSRGTGWSAVFDNAHWTLGYFLGSLLSWRGALRADKGSPERASRAGLAWGLSLYTFGQLLWDLQVFVGWNPFPGPSDLFFLLLAPATLIGLCLGWKRRHGAYPSLVMVGDVALLTLGLLVLTLGSYLPNQAATPTLSLVVMVLYPTLLFGAAGMALVLFLHDHGRLGGAKIGFVLALVTTGILWMNWNLQFLQNQLSDGAPLNVAFSLAAVTLGVAGLHWTWSPAEERREGKESGLILLPLAGVVAAAIGLLMLVSDARHSPEAQWVLAATAVLVLGLAIFRQGQLVGTLNNAKTTREALVQLHRTQSRLIKSEKLVALGELIAGIAHELNTPLAAMMSSSATINTLLGDNLVRLGKEWDSLSPEARALFAGLLPEAVAGADLIDSQKERELSKQLKQEATEAGQADSQAVAQSLLACGLALRPEVYRPLLGLAYLWQVLDLMEPLVVVLRLSLVATKATDKAATVVSALRKYLHTGDEPSPSAISLSENIEEVIPLVQHLLRRGVDFRVELEPTLFVSAWPDRLSQVWMNLLNNALQSLDKDGRSEAKRLRVQARAEGNWAVVDVVDNGPGVPPELAEKIFEPFFTTKSFGHGTGLGLSVCRSILEEIGGTLTLESQEGQTTFRVRLPRLTIS